MRVLQLIVILIFAIILIRLFNLQVLSSRYKGLADGNVLRREVLYPPRGEVYDRNGEYLVQSRECYDLMVIYREVNRASLDSVRLCEITGLSPARLTRALNDARMMPRAPRLVTNYISTEEKLLFDEADFSGFYMVYRTVRQYPRSIGGNLLGYVSEVTQSILDRRPDYRAGEYIGMYGVESAFEDKLRGEKGVRVTKVDSHGAIKGSYMDGIYDTLPQQGQYLISTIDARLQRFGEELMEGKVGAAVAIEPSTGEILMMVSSPSYDPDNLVGRDRGNNYMKLLNDPRRPLFNRAVTSKYPPGSTFKLVQGLIGLQEGVLTPSQTYNCHGGFRYGNRTLGCHPHSATTNLHNAVAWSCNTYFCHVYRNILDNPAHGGVKNGFEKWREYVLSFGFGRKLGSDFLNEGAGFVPTVATYDKKYRGSWNSLTVISLSIGQGELGCTPLQMANMAAILANRGHYYIPHIVKAVEGADSIDRRFYEPQQTMVESKYFDTIVDGMWASVNVGSDGWYNNAYVAGLDICGKTGTAENPHGRDHSTFLSFAPRDNPKIAISVYVENGGFGATIARPIASLIEEFYLTDTISRPAILKQVKEMKINYPNYAK